MVAACPFPARRGTPLRIERLAETLIARGHHVEVLTYHLCDAPGEGDYPIHRIYGNRVIEPLPPGPTIAKLSSYDPKLAQLTRRLLHDRPFDVVHAHHFEGLLAASWARRGMPIPLIYDAHTMLEAELPSYWNGFGKDLIRGAGGWLDGHIPRLADQVVAVTKEIRDSLVNRHGFASTSVHVAMNGVEVDHFEGALNRTPKGAGHIIYTGTLARYQGIELLLEAFAKARAMRPQMRLVIAASSDFGPFEAQARSLGIRDAIDLVTDSFDLLSQRLGDAAIAVLPRSDCPGIPQKLLNYMAAGKAIVACKGSGKMLEDGVNGLVVPNDDSASFAQALIRLHDDPTFARQIGAAANEYVVKHRNWNRTAEICEAAYLRAIVARQPQPAASNMTSPRPWSVEQPTVRHFPIEEMSVARVPGQIAVSSAAMPSDFMSAPISDR